MPLVPTPDLIVVEVSMNEPLLKSAAIEGCYVRVRGTQVVCDAPRFTVELLRKPVAFSCNVHEAREIIEYLTTVIGVVGT